MIPSQIRRLAATLLAATVLSRTTGLPGFHPTDWELSGIVSVLLDVGFLGALAWYARTAQLSAGSSRAVA